MSTPESQDRRTIVELSPFARARDKHLNEAEFAALTDHLSLNPGAGALIRGTGGWRKLRWATSGRGKSGGARVVTFYAGGDEVYLGDVYAKSRRASVSAAQKSDLRKAAESLTATKRHPPKT